MSTTSCSSDDARAHLNYEKKQTLCNYHICFRSKWTFYLKINFTALLKGGGGVRKYLHSRPTMLFLLMHTQCRCTQWNIWSSDLPTSTSGSAVKKKKELELHVRCKHNLYRAHLESECRGCLLLSLRDSHSVNLCYTGRYMLPIRQNSRKRFNVMPATTVLHYYSTSTCTRLHFPEFQVETLHVLFCYLTLVYQL